MAPMPRTPRTPTLARLSLSLALAGLLAGCGGEAESPEAASTSATSATALPSEPIEKENAEAERIALEAAGPGAAVTSVEEGDVGGRPVFRVAVTVDGGQREITVDRVNGEVVTNEVVG
jgi:uncharacterized membrane protein YkoI